MGYKKHWGCSSLHCQTVYKDSLLHVSVYDRVALPIFHFCRPQASSSSGWAVENIHFNINILATKLKSALNLAVVLNEDIVWYCKVILVWSQKSTHRKYVSV